MSWKLRHTSKVFWSLYDGEIICQTGVMHLTVEPCHAWHMDSAPTCVNNLGR